MGAVMWSYGGRVEERWWVQGVVLARLLVSRLS